VAGLHQTLPAEGGTWTISSSPQLSSASGAQRALSAPRQQADCVAPCPLPRACPDAQAHVQAEVRTAQFVVRGLPSLGCAFDHQTGGSTSAFGTANADKSLGCSVYCLQLRKEAPRAGQGDLHGDESGWVKGYRVILAPPRKPELTGLSRPRTVSALSAHHAPTSTAPQGVAAWEGSNRTKKERRPQERGPRAVLPQLLLPNIKTAPQFLHRHRCSRRGRAATPTRMHSPAAPLRRAGAPGRRCARSPARHQLRTAAPQTMPTGRRRMPVPSAYDFT
jgi:hypothetical protein